MPSHILHDLFAREAISTYLPSSLAAVFLSEHSSALTLGAQGPDLFFHNRRRRPSGVQIGAKMHRKGYGTTVAEMARTAGGGGSALVGHDGRSPATLRRRWAYVFGFATHAILDRHLHPFINYFAGWRRAGDGDTEHLRYAHPLFERVLDVLFCEAKRGVHPSSIDFYSQVRLNQNTEKDTLALLEHAARCAYDLDDPKLGQRVRNAYLDSIGYYKHCNQLRLDDLTDTAARSPDQLRRWLTLIHPPILPRDIDFLNEGRRRWCLPCDEKDVRQSTAWELYRAAVREAESTITALAAMAGDFSARTVESQAVDAIAESVGNSDLSSTREARCVRKYSDPLPLHRVVDEIMDRISPGS
jgi:hypothetical protein